MNHPRQLARKAGNALAALLVAVALFADCLSSDLPLIVKVDGHLQIAPSLTHPAEARAPADSAPTTSSNNVCVLSALSRYGPDTEDLSQRLQPPRFASGHWFGTDRYGRDVFARVIHGTRTYLVFALAAVGLSLGLGAIFGALAGFFGGFIDSVVTRLIDTISAFPPLVLILGVQAAVPQASGLSLFFAIALTRWPETARLVRAEVQHVATRDYVMAARALGASRLRVLRNHIAPNVRGQLVVLGALGIPAVILVEASVDFLRVGEAATHASWGETMSQFRDAPDAWWLLAFPGALLFITIAALGFVGEARRDALDPRGH